MDERGDRGRAFHRIGQPRMQRHLRGFTHRTDKKANAGNRQQHPVRARQLHSGELVGLFEHIRIVHGTRVGEQQTDPEHEAEVADAVHDKRLHVGENCGRPRIPEADQQVGHQAHRFPAEEQLNHVVRHDQHQHRKGKQRDVRKEPLIARVIGHVADGVDVHHERHESDHDHHQRGERIDQEADFEFSLAKQAPRVERSVEPGATEHIGEHHERADRRHHHQGNRDQVRSSPTDEVAQEACAEQARQNRAQQGRKRDDQIERRYARHFVTSSDQPLRRSSSSTLIVLRLRNSRTRMARPIAASAAATVRMKNTNTCPA